MIWAASSIQMRLNDFIEAEAANRIEAYNKRLDTRDCGRFAHSGNWNITMEDDRKLSIAILSYPEAAVLD
jgi:hypothetical protein